MIAGEIMSIDKMHVNYKNKNNHMKNLFKSLYNYRVNSIIKYPLNCFKVSIVIALFPIIGLAQTSIFLEDFEGGTLGPFINSNVQNTLSWVNTDIRGGDSGHSTSKTAYFGNPADTSFNTGFAEGAQMTSGAIDLSAYSSVNFSFNYFLQTENYTGYDVAQVLLSTDSITFTAVADNQPNIGNLNDGMGVWQSLNLDISSIAGNSTVYVRVAFNTVDNVANNYEGFYIDDIRLYDPTVIDFSMSTNAGCAPLQVTFTNLTTQLGAFLYNWYFNDGSSMYQETFSTTLNHTFVNNGTYNVQMEVYNSLGTLLGSKTRSVTVNGLSSWEQLYLYPNNPCPGESVSFNAPFGFQKYIYNKGDGSPNDTLFNNWVNYQYSTPGTYIASVEIENVCGNNDTVLRDTITINSTMPFPTWINIGSSSPSVAACPNDNISFWGPWGFASYEWDFGDGNAITTTNSNVAHTYGIEGNFTVSCRVFNYCGDDSLLTLTQLVQYPPFPSVSLNINPTPACPGENVFLSAPWGYAAYEWDYGDGSPIDSSMNATRYHIYPTLGSYTVSVKVTQSCGNDTTLVGTLNVNSYVPFPATANLSSSPNPACPFEPIAMNGMSGYPYYEWDFGDGTPLENNTSASSSHIYATTGTYAASLKITDLCGTDTTLIDTVTINSSMPFPSSIGFAFSANPSCPGTVSINASAGYQFYTWDFGDGSSLETTTSNTNAHSYPQPGTYPIALKIVNYCGADTTLLDTLVVGYTPFPGNMYLNFYPTSSCPNENINFSTSWGYVSYDWDFGDGSTTTASSYVSHEFASTGNYIVSVTINQLCGNDTTLYDTVSIVNNQMIPSWVSLYTSPDVACPMQNIYMNGPWGFAQYIWDYGDGNVDTTTNSYIQYEYAAAGDYQVALTVANFCGIDTILNDSIKIDPDLEVGYASLYVWYQNGSSACPNEFVNLNGPYGYSSYVWDYGDGTSMDSGSFSVMNHAYADAGVYTAAVTVTNECGNDTTVYQSVTIDDNKPFGWVSLWSSMTPVCPGSDVRFNASSGYAAYIWDFGDGSPLDSTNTSNNKRQFAGAGTYIVEVKIFDYCGKDTTVSTTVTIDGNLATSAYINMYPNPICPNQEAIFSTDTNHVAYFWDFGDGFSAYGPAETNHSYAALGEYDVSVTITSHCGIDSTYTSSITVDTTTSFPSWMNFSGNPWQVCPGEIITLVTEDGFNNYFWDFGDGDTVTTSGSSIGHAYDVAGNYNAAVTITNGCGNSTTLTTTVNVSSSTNVFVPQITTANGAYCPGDQVSFLLSSWNGGEDNYTYVWDFDDGDMDTTIGVGATHVYDSAGSYTTSVTILNACGNSDMVIVPVNIVNNASPTLNSNIFGTLASTTIAGCAGDAIVFYFQGSSDNLWEFGDGSNGVATEEFMDENGITMTVIKHAYSNTGTYIVKLTLTNSCGNSTTDSLTIQISDNFLVDGGLILEPPANTGSYTTCSNINMIAFGGSSYEWDFGDGNTLTTISPTISHVFSDEGNYSISVTITNGCGNSTTFSDAVTIIESGGISPNISVPSAVTCFGGSDGTALAAPSGGLAPYQYQWDDDNTQSTAAATGLTAGTYSIIITDDLGCSADTSIEVGEAVAISISNSTTDATCGSSDGTATAVVDSGGVSPFTYAWSSGGNTSTDTGLSSGSYIVSVTDADGCSNSVIAAVSDVGGPTLSIAAPTDATCNGDADGALTATASNGTPPYQYTWSNSDNTAAITGLTAGEYIVTITDSTSCLTVGTAVVGEPDELEASFEVVEGECGEATGQSTVTVTGGTSGYFYQWDSNAGSQVTATATGLSANAYEVIITDVNSCTLTATTTVGNSNSPMLSADGTDVSCFGAGDGSIDLTVTGGTTPYVYLWTWTGGSSFVEDLSDLEPDDYTVMVQDGSDCWIGTSVEITEPQLSSTMSVTNTGCISGNNGAASVTVSSGYQPYTYLWSNSATSSSLSGLIADTYTVLVTDSNECTLNDTAIVSDPSAIVSGITATHVSCNGGSDGEAELTVSGGSAPYVYLWDNPGASTTADITVLAAGTYRVTITDSCSITAMDSIVITEPALLTVTMTYTDVSCYGGGDGTATATPSGGTIPYNYVWNNGQTDSTAVGLFPGLQAVNVFDLNGCIGANNVTIGEPGALTVAAAATDATCNGGADGGVTLTISGGTVPYEYAWSNGDSTMNISGVAAGTYTVSVTDSCGSAVIVSASVDEPDAPSLAVTTLDVSCNAGNDGSVDLTVSGGTSPYAYLWSNAATTEDISGLVADTYSVAITDACGLTLADTSVITEPAQLTTSITGNNTTCYAVGDGSATVTAAGGTTPYNYQWSNSQTSSTAIGLFPGNYSVNVTDDNGCLASALITITQPDDLVLTISTVEATCNTADGSALVSVTGGTSPYSYLWDDAGAQSTAAAAALVDGTYMVNVSDSNGCADSATATVDITVPAPEICLVDVDSTGKYVVVWEKTGSVVDSFRIYRETSTTGVYELIGTQAYGVQSDFSDQDSYPEVKSELYKISAIDACGNESVLSDYHRSLHLITSPALGNDVVLSWDNYIGFGYVKYRIWRGISQNSMTLMDSVSSSISNYTDTMPPALDSLFYQLEVVHPSGCLATKTKNYNSSKSNTSSANTTSDLDVSVTSQDASAGNCDGEVEAFATGGDAPYTYLWDDSNAQTTATATGLCVGQYTVLVIDANGDSTTTSGYVGQGGVTITATTTSTNASAGICDGTATVTASGGIEPYTYVWDGNTSGQTTQTATGLCPGTYSVNVFDSLGNMTTVFATVSETVGILEFDNELSAISVFPNPYTDQTKISFTLNRKADVTLEIFNIIGEKVAVLAIGERVPGEHVFMFGAKSLGHPAGVYMLRLNVHGETYMKRIIELK